MVRVCQISSATSSTRSSRGAGSRRSQPVRQATRHGPMIKHLRHRRTHGMIDSETICFSNGLEAAALYAVDRDDRAGGHFGIRRMWPACLPLSFLRARWVRVGLLSISASMSPTAQMRLGRAHVGDSQPRARGAQRGCKILMTVGYPAAGDP
jgi:hypothetical protein